MLILIILLYRMKINFNSFNDDYLSKEATLPIKGLFVLLVFLRHFKNYINPSNNLLDNLFYSIDGKLGQLIVVMFLFYSGFGIAKQIQIKNKDGEYIRHFIKRRLFPVWTRFAICVAFFLITDILIGTVSNYSLLQILLSFTGWTSIGNSNWFMCITFILYLIVYLSYRLFSFENKRNNLIVLSILCVILLVIMYFVKDESWWDTLLCFPLGMWYAYFQNKIDIRLHNIKTYLFSLSVLLLSSFGLLLFSVKIDSTGISFIPVSLMFALITVLLTMKIRIKNKILDFFGKHVFSIYILQRIPMIIFKDFIDNRYLFLIVSFIITVVIAVGFDYLCDKFRCMINKKGKSLENS